MVDAGAGRAALVVAAVPAHRVHAGPADAAEAGHALAGDVEDLDLVGAGRGQFEAQLGAGVERVRRVRQQ